MFAEMLLKTIAREIDSYFANNPDSARDVYQNVFDLQPNGSTRLGAVEEFRRELNNLAAQGNKLAERFVATLPHYWYVQDAEEYVDLSAEQQKMQEFSCSYARFILAMQGGNNTREVLWRSFWPAHELIWNPTTERSEQIPIMVGEHRVHAFANDSVAFGGRILTQNPRVADVGDVVRNAYAYFVARNKDAYLNIEQEFPNKS